MYVCMYKRPISQALVSFALVYEYVSSSYMLFSFCVVLDCSCLVCANFCTIRDSLVAGKIVCEMTYIMF